ARRLPRRSILIVDPDAASRALVEAVLKGDHWVRGAPTGQEAIDAYDAPRAFDYVILDVALMGPPSGAEVLLALRKKDPKARIILLTQLASDSELVRKCMPQAYALLRKPEGLKDVRDLLT
ncbi:response regulator, partial [bacterium]|nr:response regulator [bacterium]